MSSDSSGKILFCDDNEQNRYIVSKYLRDAKFEVWEASTGRDAIALALRAPDIAILDVQLPDMSGYEVCKWIKSDPRTSAIPVLHVSATFVRGSDRAEGLDSGADAYLTSPVEPPELIATVNALLRARRAEEQIRKINERLREEARRKDEFLAMLGHELRNPLGPIRNSVHIISRVESTNPTVARANKMIERQVSHLARLVDDLLDVSRLSSGKILLRRRRMDIVQAARHIAEDHRHAFEASGVSLSVSTPHGPIWVEADSVRIAQVIGNLLHNGQKFTDPGGNVSLTVAKEGDFVRITVEDTGIGMSPEMISRMFLPFSQADNSLDRTRGGLGLGLALVKGIVELHGGSVKAESAGVGKGTAVTVFLPVEKIPAPEKQELREESSTDPTGVRNILIIEDNLDAAESIQLLLTLEGLTVNVAHNGQSGIAMAEKIQPDVILCDIGLPGSVNGYVVAETLRKDPRFSSTFLIALTGYGQESDIHRAKSAGFDVHLTKPVDPLELQKVLATTRDQRNVPIQ